MRNLYDYCQDLLKPRLRNPRRPPRRRPRPEQHLVPVWMSSKQRPWMSWNLKCVPWPWNLSWLNLHGLMFSSSGCRLWNGFFSWPTVPCQAALWKGRWTRSTIWAWSCPKRMLFGRRWGSTNLALKRQLMRSLPDFFLSLNALICHRSQKYIS